MIGSERRRLLGAGRRFEQGAISAEEARALAYKEILVLADRARVEFAARIAARTSWDCRAADR